jgi:hypothetical protein
VAGFKLEGSQSPSTFAAPVARSAPAARPTAAAKPVAKPSASAAAKKPWDGTERRGPHRATNVERLPAPPKPAAKTAAASNGTNDEWESF